MRRMVGLDLNGWHDFAVRKRDEDADPAGQGPVTVDGGFGSVIVSHDEITIGGPQAILSPIGRGKGWSDIGAQEKRRDLRSVWLRLLRGAVDHQASRDLPYAVDALAVHAGSIGLCIPDRPAMAEAAQQAILDALVGLRRPTTTLIWRSVALALAALDGELLPWAGDGTRVLCVVHAADGMEVQGFTLRALADHPGWLAPERAKPGSVLCPNVGLDRLLAKAETAVTAANPHRTDRPTELSRLPLALLLADDRPAEPEVVRRDNGTWTLTSPPDVFDLPWEAFTLAPVLESADVVLLHSPLALRHIEGLVDWLGVSGRTLHRMDQAAPAWGAFFALQRIARGIPHYLDRLDQVALAVLGPTGPIFEDLIPPDATVPGNREYVSAPITSMIWSEGMKTAQFFIRKGESTGPYEIRTWTTPNITAPEKNEPLDIRLRQKPAQGWANLLITAPRWERLRRAPIRLEWTKMQVDPRNAQDVLEALRGRPPVVPAPVHYPAHIGLWDGSLRNPGLRVLLERARRRTPENMHALANALGASAVIGASRYYAVGTDGTLPSGLGAEAVKLFNETIAELADDLIRRGRRGPPPEANDALRCLTWSFARCPPAIVDELTSVVRLLEQRRSHPWLEPLRADVVVLQGLGRVATSPALLREMIPRFADGSTTRDRLGALAAILSRPASTPAVLAELVQPDVPALAARLTQTLDAVIRARQFGVHLKYALLAVGGLLRVRQVTTWALVAHSSEPAERLAKRLEVIADLLKKSRIRIAAADAKRESAVETAKILRGEGGRPDILIFVEQLPDA